MERSGDRPKYLSDVTMQPTRMSQTETSERSRYRKFLKIRTLVFAGLTLIFLPLGIFFVAFFQGPEYSSSLRAFGIIVTVLGIGCLIITAIYLPIFIRLMSARSTSSAYQPKSAEALKHLKYPRQPTGENSSASRLCPVEMPGIPTGHLNLEASHPPTSSAYPPSAPPPYSEIKTLPY